MEIEKDKFIEISRKGNVSEFIYIASNYPGPVAINATIHQPERLSPEVQHFENGWHRQDTKEHICIWSDEWLKNNQKMLKCDSPNSENK